MAKKQPQIALVVTNDFTSQDEIAAVLTRLGFDPVFHGNGHEGQNAIRSYRPRLIIIQVFSPDNDEDVIVLRAAQASSFSASIVFSQDVKRTKRLLGLESAPCNGTCQCGVFNLAQNGQLETAIRAHLQLNS